MMFHLFAQAPGRPPRREAHGNLSQAYRRAAELRSDSVLSGLTLIDANRQLELAHWNRDPDTDTWALDLERQAAFSLS